MFRNFYQTEETILLQMKIYNKAFEMRASKQKDEPRLTRLLILKYLLVHSQALCKCFQERETLWH